MVETKVRNPLSDDQRGSLKGWASLAKRRNVLTPYNRKVLFQAGEFDEWFPSRFIRIGKGLEALDPVLSDEDRIKARAIRGLISQEEIVTGLLDTIKNDDPVRNSVLGPLGMGHGDFSTREKLLHEVVRLLKSKDKNDQNTLNTVRRVVSGDLDKNTPLEELLERGEDEQTEFKETFSKNPYSGKMKDLDLKLATLKDVASFLNTKGGVLLLGVNDSGEVTGIEQDRYEGEESYKRDIVSSMREALNPIADLVELKIEEVNTGCRVCKIVCQPSLNEPVYCTFHSANSATFVRMENVSYQPERSEWDKIRANRWPIKSKH